MYFDEQERYPVLTQFLIRLYLFVPPKKTPILQEKISTIILAAGIGKRMRSRTPKVMHKILGVPMIGFVLKNAHAIKSAQIVLVVNRLSDAYRSLGADLQYAVQKEQLGSGDAALQGVKAASCDRTLILCGDVPLLKTATLLRMLSYHKQEKASLTILTCKMKDPYGYGRIVRGKKQSITAIVEQTDANARQQKIREINAGVYYGDKELLISALEKTTNKNDQGEFYLTDAVHYIASRGKKVCGYMIEDETEIIGINTKVQLAHVREFVKRDLFTQLMQRGVYIEDPNTTNIDLTVKVGDHVHVRPHTLIEGRTEIPDGETVGPFVWIRDGKYMKIPAD